MSLCAGVTEFRLYSENSNNCRLKTNGIRSRAEWTVRSPNRVEDVTEVANCVDCRRRDPDDTERQSEVCKLYESARWLNHVDTQKRYQSSAPVWSCFPERRVQALVELIRRRHRPKNCHSRMSPVSVRTANGSGSVTAGEINPWLATRAPLDPPSTRHNLIGPIAASDLCETSSSQSSPGC